MARPKKEVKQQIVNSHVRVQITVDIPVNNAYHLEAVKQEAENYDVLAILENEYETQGIKAKLIEKRVPAETL
jgi:hypothetical protein